MSYSLIPFAFILLSVSTIIVIVIRKFPQLTLLDVDNIPAVKEEKKKEEFLKKRAADQVSKFKKVSLKNLFAPLGQGWKKKQSAFRRYVYQIERRAAKEAAIEKATNNEPTVINEEELKVLLREGDYFLEKGDNNTAENKYIAAIRLDAKNVFAYKGLAEVYWRTNQWDQAEETWKFLLQLSPGDDNIFVKLGDLMEQKGDLIHAVEYYEKAIILNDQNATRFNRYADLSRALGQNETALEAARQAAEIEPNNPKYLDNLVELAIIVGDKKLAFEAWQNLRMANPENQKLAVLKEKIANIK